jgi:GNAT superfamily N-acetyltransferase
MVISIDLKFLAEDVRIFYPLEGESPAQMLVSGGLDASFLPRLAREPLIRVAKHRGEIIGAFLSSQIGAEVHRLEALAVCAPFRRRGVGSWLVGHAIGVSESRGARTFLARANTGADGLFRRLGFQIEAADWVMRIDPE